MLPQGHPFPTSLAGSSSRILGEGSRGEGRAVASSERLCLPPL